MNEMRVTEKEIKKVEEVLSEVRGKKPYEVPLNLIHDLYNYSFKYLELLKGLRK